jgi:hypothetical protein
MRMLLPCPIRCWLATSAVEHIEYVTLAATIPALATGTSTDGRSDLRRKNFDRRNDSVTVEIWSCKLPSRRQKVSARSVNGSTFAPQMRYSLTPAAGVMEPVVP